MSFNYPLGLLGLIGIPVLIIVYILKSRYAEQTVSTIYLWQLSEKFLKRKKRINPFSGILSLILQILAVVSIVLAIAQPVYTIPNSASEYCFILDGSGSMNTVSNSGKTRFEEGKAEIQKLINSSKEGSTYTLVYAGNSTVEVFREVKDKATALNGLKSLECGFGMTTCVDAIGVAQEYFTEDCSPIVYLVTDKEYGVENINLINLSKDEENYALCNYRFTKSTDKSNIVGEVISYKTDAELTVKAYIDGNAVAESKVSTKKLIPSQFIMPLNVTSFDEIMIKIEESDSLTADNIGYVYSMAEDKNNKTLLISDAPAYIEFALLASGKTAVETVSTKKYSENKDYYTGYGLYIFDTFSDFDRLPSELPKNASVWFFNLQSSLPKTGFSFREVVKAEGDSYFEPTFTNASSSFAKTITKDLLRQSLAVKQYSKYMTNRNFTTVLSNNGDGLVFVGTNENGNRQVVFSFDLHDSDFTMKPDYLILMKNLLSYSFPDVIEKTLYSVGEEMVINIPTSCDDLVLESPSGKKNYLDFSAEYSYAKLTEYGTYCLKAKTNGTLQEYKIFVKVPQEESCDTDVGVLSLTKYTDSVYSDGYYDNLWAYFALLAIVFLLDWGVYCYEQYQLL